MPLAPGGGPAASASPGPPPGDRGPVRRARTNPMQQASSPQPKLPDLPSSRRPPGRYAQANSHRAARSSSVNPGADSISPSWTSADLAPASSRSTASSRKQSNKDSAITTSPKHCRPAEPPHPVQVATISDHGPSPVPVVRIPTAPTLQTTDITKRRPRGIRPLARKRSPPAGRAARASRSGTSNAEIATIRPAPRAITSTPPPTNQTALIAPALPRPTAGQTSACPAGVNSCLAPAVSSLGEIRDAMTPLGQHCRSDGLGIAHVGSESQGLGDQTVLRSRSGRPSGCRVRAYRGFLPCESSILGVGGDRSAPPCSRAVASCERTLSSAAPRRRRSRRSVAARDARAPAVELDAIPPGGRLPPFALTRACSPRVRPL